ncbi:GTPase IMAP family member 7-like [Ylistrum balloti]|uniref:GTPase IMAP family member 7-like n=1 Tax=Ylistrum balloti TaxID=509963 RepID=UPI002905C46C|nr:GTPase IMAP family member 7-like [Ylistrum balloti]
MVKNRCFCSLACTTSRPELRVLLVGETGCGKSMAGNVLLGADLFVTGADAKAWPKEKCFRGESEKIRGWDKVVVVDTPGKFFYIGEEDEKKKKGEITKIAGMLSPGPHVIILVLSKVKGNGSRRANEEEIVKFYAKTFGKKIENHFVFLFAGEDDDYAALATLHEDSYLKLLIKETPKNYMAFNVTTASKPKFSEKMLSVVTNVVERNRWGFHTDKIFQDVQMKNQEREKEIRKYEDDSHRKYIDQLRSEQRRRVQDLERKYDEMFKKANMSYQKRTHPDTLRSRVRDEYQNETGIWNTIEEMTTFLWKAFKPFIKKLLK